MSPGPAIPAHGPATPAHDAVILAGGAARRFGGQDKPGALVGGTPLIARVIAAVPGADRIIVVGPPRDLPEVRRAMRPGLEPGAESGREPDGESGGEPAGEPGLKAAVEFTLEDPPGGGPVPALRAGLARVSAPWVALLAADLPFFTSRHLGALFAAAGERGAVLEDEGGREQWLAGVWRAEVLQAALGRYEGRSLFGLLGPLGPVRVRVPEDGSGRTAWFDCDTAEDLAAADVKERNARERTGGVDGAGLP